MEIIGRKRPVQKYSCEVPFSHRGVFPLLEEAAELGGDLYLAQQFLEERAREKGVERVGAAANNPSTVPNSEGKWVLPHRHPELLGLLRTGQGLLTSAAVKAEEAGDMVLARNVYEQGDALVSGNQMRAWKAYLRAASKVNFHLLRVENIGGKDRWQGYLGVQNTSISSHMIAHINQLRAAGIRKLGRWPTPQTLIEADDVAVMAGYIAPQVQSVLRQQAGLSYEFDLSAQNIPNQKEIKGKHGSRIIIFNGSFGYVLIDLDRVARRFMLNPPTHLSYIKFLGAHELEHDIRPEDGLEVQRLGLMLASIDEAVANMSAIDLSADTWPIGSSLENELAVREIVVGLVGYSLRDAESYLRGQRPIPDIYTLARLDSHIPGSLGFLNLLMATGYATLAGGLLSISNLDGVISLCRRLAKEERKIFDHGAEQDAASHFESMMPKGPLFDHDESEEAAA